MGAIIVIPACLEMGGRWLIPLLLLGLAWGQELIDQLLFGGQWNLAYGTWPAVVEGVERTVQPLGLRSSHVQLVGVSALELVGADTGQP